MTVPHITAQNVFIIPTPATSQAAPRKKFVAAPEARCRALTKLPNAVDHRGPQCSRRKVLDTSKPQAQKNDKDLVADELCNQHKMMLDRFAAMITKQLREEKLSILAPAADPPVVATVSAGTSTAQRGFRNSDIMNVSNEIVFDNGMRFDNGGNSTGDSHLNHARGHRTPHISSRGDTARKTKSISSRTSSVNLGVSYTHEARRGSTAFNPGTYSSGVIDEEIDQGAAPITSPRPSIKSNNSASSFKSRNDLRRSDVNAINTAAGPSTPSDNAYDPDYTRITENVGTPVAGLNSAVIPPSVSRPHSNHSLPMGDNRTRTRTRTLNGSETPQVYRVDCIAPSFQEVPNFMVHHAPQKLVPSTGTAHEHSSLVRQCTYLTEIHNSHLDRASAGTVDWQKKRAIEDLVAAVDGLVSLDDAIAGSLIGDCETLLDNHTHTAEGSLKTLDAHKLSMMRDLKQQLDILRHCVTEAVEDPGQEERDQDTESTEL